MSLVPAGRPCTTWYVHHDETEVVESDVVSGTLDYERQYRSQA